MNKQRKTNKDAETKLIKTDDADYKHVQLMFKKLYSFTNKSNNILSQVNSK